jgi:hypothetical protein
MQPEVQVFLMNDVGVVFGELVYLPLKDLARNNAYPDLTTGASSDSMPNKPLLKS